MKLLRSVVLLAAVAVLYSCSSPLSNRVESYVDKVENNCDAWSTDEWEVAQLEYEELMKEYEMNYDSYTAEEKAAINRAIGRYNGLLVKHGFEQVGNALQELGQQIPSLIEGFMSAFEDKDE